MAKLGNKRLHAHSDAKELPDWVVERMTTGELLKDKAFDLETSEGRIRVAKGMVIAETTEGHIYACLPTQMNATLTRLEGTDPLPPVEAKPAPAPARAPVATAAAPAEAPAAVAGKKSCRPLMALGSMPNLQWCQIDKLNVDDTYQRSIEGAPSQKLILKIAMEWDWRLCIPLLVVQRQGGLYVIDGQHRLEGAKLRAQLGANDVPQLPCAIFSFDSVGEEAALFVQANRSRRPMGRLDVFHAQLAAGDEKATALNAIVTAAGLTIGRNEQWQMLQPGEVVFTTAIAKGIRILGDETAGKLLKMIGTTFEGEILNTGSAIFAGLVDLYNRADPESPIDDEVVASVLAARTMKEWREAVASADGGFGRAEAMVGLIRDDYAKAKGA